MKKALALLLAVITLLSLTACSKKEKTENFGGTWKVDSIEYEGAKFSVQEWNNMEDEDFSEFYIIFKDGGKAYVYDDGYGDLVDWLKSDDSIMIGDEKCSIVDKMICFDYYGDKIYLKKVSDNQTIPQEKDTNDDENEDEYSENVSVDDKSENTDTEWKEFLADYEAWVDDYIEIVKKYKENPADTSILSDYSAMLSEMSEWTEKADEIELELEDTNAAIEYSAELLRIVAKLSEVAY